MFKRSKESDIAVTNSWGRRSRTSSLKALQSQLADGLRPAEEALVQQIGTGLELIGQRKK